MKKEVISFRKEIAPNTTEVLKERVKDNGSIEELRVRFYAGQERELRVRPFVVHHGGLMEDFLTYHEGTESYLSGEDDSLIFPVSVAVQYDDFINIHVENKNATYTYTLVVDIVVSYDSMEVI